MTQTAENSSDASHCRWRYTIFLVLEGCFTALVWYCYSHPRPLPTISFIQIGMLKSGFIALFNFWHYTAIASANEICFEAFSREWAPRPEVEKTDVVSKVTSGGYDRFLYFWDLRATNTFRFGFLLFLGLIVMNTIGTSSVTVSDGSQSGVRIDVGRITTPNITPNSTDIENDTFLARLNEASLSVRLEQLDGVPWGYVPQPNWLIPLPINTLVTAIRVSYSSDLVSFQNRCGWRAPDAIVNNAVSVGGDTWRGGFFVGSSPSNSTTGSVNGSSILHLSPNSTPTGASAYLFLGGNQSFPPNLNNTQNAWIDLTNQPTLYNPSGFRTSGATNLAIYSPLASLLLCDPLLHFTAGNVVVSPTPNLTDPDMTIGINSAEKVGNIDQSAAQSLFTSILSFAINLPDTVLDSDSLIPYINFNAVAGHMLLDLPPAPVNWSASGGIRPSSPDAIGHQMDIYMLSALKAFTSGYRGDANIEQVTGTFDMPVDAQSTVTGAALTTSLQFAILHSVLLVILLFGLAWLAHLNMTQNRPPFTLHFILKERSSQGGGGSEGGTKE
ncbi:hypothetical protein NP233_g5183 [Leucocoprinus birnbaumii]|uniref:Uncharacterized protein n=1 Tax=Leucocoprinus birnbaumii TaxID=56174 RepID=A0AAD5VTS6_9AGAR|nr:hypothetical protein NP233_g5183 [Leucocoprinus birnbaumii]